jgi:hypothetical protein
MTAMGKREKAITYHDYRNNGISVCALFRPKKEGDDVSPIYWRVTYKRKQKFYSTGLSLSKSDWIEVVTSRKTAFKDIRKNLDDYFDNVMRKAVDDLAGKGMFSFPALDILLDRGESAGIVSAFKSRIRRFAESGRIRQADIHAGTLRALLRFKYYQGLTKREKEKFINQCIDHKHKSIGDNKIVVPENEIPFDSITVDFLERMEDFLRETGSGNSSISIHMRTLRSVINQKEEKCSPFLTGAKYPFGEGNNGYIIPEGNRKQLAIQIEDIWRIEDFETDNLKLEYARDMFLFMFYSGGLNFGDVCRLKYSNIDADTSEIVILRKKTNKAKNKTTPPTVYIPLIPPLVQIINKYGNKNMNGYIFPVLNDTKGEKAITRKISDELESNVNKPLKIISKNLGIGSISTSTARNTYMTHMEVRLMYNTSVTKQMVGHKIKDVTAGYVNLNPALRREINSKLLNPEKNYSKVMSSVV